MADFELVMPKLGESIIEATILNWVKKEGDEVDVDETILEIATDKVDSEIPSPVKGVIKKVMFGQDDVVPIGETIALIETTVESNGQDKPVSVEPAETVTQPPYPEEKNTFDEKMITSESPPLSVERIPPVSGDRFYSPLVRKIATEEGVTLKELDALPASGLSNRVTKKDILSYIEGKDHAGVSPEVDQETQNRNSEVQHTTVTTTRMEGDEEIVEMDRTRKLIAQHMIDSKNVAAHVTSFVEVDVTNIVDWRSRHKTDFEEKHGTKLTFTPIFIQAVVKAIHDYPMINSSIRDGKIILKKKINIGMATAMPNGNLIVPVIKETNNFNLVGLAKRVNDLADRARNHQLQAEEIQDGTFTVTNVGTFGNVMGTPIINQPQVAILAIGAIRKKPAVVETKYGDLIAIRQMMFLSLSYDHRIIDGYLGGSFLRRIADYMEQFEDENILR